MANTLAFDTDHVYASGGYPDKQILCVRADDGTADASRVVWRETKSVAYVPSPLLDQGRLYLMDDDGVASCLDAATGTTLWRKRLGGKFTASPILAGERLYVTSEAGITHVLKAGDHYERLAKNDLEEDTFATLCVSGERIYLRTERALYALEARTAEAEPPAQTPADDPQTATD